MAGCAARQQGIAAELPRKTPKRARGLLHGTHFLLRDAMGRVGVRSRPASGLFGGMLELPGTPWRDTPWPEAEAMAHAPAAGVNWRRVEGEATHQLTHRDLSLRLYAGQTRVLPENLAPLGAERDLPSAMRKLLRLGG
jgi:A/G-specific adenine glycosylase